MDELERMIMGEALVGEEEQTITDNVDELEEITAITSDAQSMAWMNTLYHSHRFSDLTIRCGTFEFKAHRNIVCPQSAFFNSALENNMQEAQTGVIELKEDEVPIVEAMLQFLYYRDYKLSRITNMVKDPRLVFEVKIYAIADKYFLEPLKKLAEAKFCARGKRAGREEFIDAARAITTRQFGNADGLRQTVANLVYANAGRLFEDASRTTRS